MTQEEASKKFTRDYFVAKFEKIPDDKWCLGGLGDDEGRCCALGHCHPTLGALSTEGEHLARLFPEHRDVAGKLIIARINDGEHPQYRQTTPKARVLAALRDL